MAKRLGRVRLFRMVAGREEGSDEAREARVSRGEAVGDGEEDPTAPEDDDGDDDDDAFDFE